MGGELRRSAVHQRHVDLGAHLTPFAGWEMPLDYGSVVAEHRAVREGSGVFDLSHLGTLRISGSGAAACAQRAFSNDVGALGDGHAQYTLCLDHDGGIVDDLLLYRLAADELFAVPNAANTDAVLGALQDAAGDATEVRDVKASTAVLAVQGPRSAEVLRAVGIPTDGLDYLTCREDPARGILSRSGYTGERGYEIFLPADHAPVLWDRLADAGATPAGLGARDTLRLEMGYPLHGNDIGRDTSPVEAGLGWAVKPGTGFRGERAYVRAKEAGAARRLRGLRATGRGIPRAGCAVTRDGEAAGAVTSGTFSPTLRVGIALAYLSAGVELGEAVDIDVRGRAVPAEVVRPPFVDADPRA